MIFGCGFRVETENAKKHNDFNLNGDLTWITRPPLLKIYSGPDYSLTRCFSVYLLILSMLVCVDNFEQGRRVKDNAGFRFGFEFKNGS